MGGVVGKILGISKPSAPAVPPPVKPVAAAQGATFEPGDTGMKKEKKMAAVKQGKRRLSRALGVGTSSGVNKGY